MIESNIMFNDNDINDKHLYIKHTTGKENFFQALSRDTATLILIQSLAI